MQNAINTTISRKKLADARAGQASLPPIIKIALGTGGVDGTGTVIPLRGTETELNNEILRKSTTVKTIGDTAYRYKIVIEKSEINNEKITEMALVDADEEIIFIKRFEAQSKTEDLEFEFYVDDIL